MAAKTPSSVTPMAYGNRLGFIANFADIDDGDTWTTGLNTTPVHYNINNTTDGVVISATFSSKVFTFAVAGAGSNKTGTLEVII